VYAILIMGVDVDINHSNIAPSSRVVRVIHIDMNHS